MTQAQALEILKTGANVFLTGEPGAGKTHLVREYVQYLRSHDIKPAITASTGIAATHIGGMTIHAWSGIGINEKLSLRDLNKIAGSERVEKRVSQAKVLIIDEISMLPPSTLSMVDKVCQHIKQNDLPFGGLQIVAVGDFFQLPPVRKNNYDSVTKLINVPEGRFAYESRSWAHAKFQVCYLTEQYRQDDQAFLQILSAIRRNIFTNNHLQQISARKIVAGLEHEHIPKLFSHNVDVDLVNDEKLAKLPGRTEIFDMSTEGPEAPVKALMKGCLSPAKLCLKIGASVMFTKNNIQTGVVNGTLGTVVGFETDTNRPQIKIKNGRRVTAELVSWAIENNGKILAKISQIPLRLAWAITVHKSQGMSLDEAVMDLSQVFEFGQGYVALSRVRRLTGLHILGWNTRAFQVDPAVIKQDEEWRGLSQQQTESVSRLEARDIKERQDNFILSCGGKLQTITDYEPVEFEYSYERGRKKNKVKTENITFDLWQEGKTIAQIAESRSMVPSTIMSHLEKLSASGKINKTDFYREFTPKLFTNEAEIKAAFHALDTTKLAPVLERLKGEFTYDELRLVRLTLE
ncbi:MAG: helix-turn-helix domain-containing protein [Patescibacteria group bacterium]